MKKLVLLIITLFSIIINISVFATHTGEENAKYLYELGLFSGKSTTEFVPALKDQTTAAEAIVLIGRALKWEVDNDAVSSFSDVPDWAVPYIEYAKNNGITSGIGDGLFGVDQIDGKRIFTWFLAALGEDKADVWANTTEYANSYNIIVPETSLREDVVNIIFNGIHHPRVGEVQLIRDKITVNDSILPGLPRKFQLNFDGGGPWKQSIILYNDGTFSGYYLRLRAGDVFSSEFHGTFEVGEKISDYAYQFSITDLVIDIPPGATGEGDFVTPLRIDDLSSDAKLIYYLPGQPTNLCHEDYNWWLKSYLWGAYDFSQLPEVQPIYGFYDVENQDGYFEILH